MMLKLKIKDYISILVVLIGLYTLFFYLPSRKNIAINGIETVGIIEKKGIGKTIFYSFYYKDSIYKDSKKILRLEEFQNLKIGSKYKVFFDPEDLTNSNIILNEEIK